MLRAAELHAEGKSTREIGRLLGCSHDTVWRDLRKWEAEQKVTALSGHAVRKLPHGGENLTPRSDGGVLDESTVISLRKTS